MCAGGTERRGPGDDLDGRRRGAGDAAGGRGAAGAAGAQPQGRHRAQQGHASEGRARCSGDGLLAANSGGVVAAPRLAPPRPARRPRVAPPPAPRWLLAAWYSRD